MGINATAIPLATVKTSKLVADADINLGEYRLTASQLKADLIDERTTGAGVVISYASSGDTAIWSNVYVDGNLAATVPPPNPSPGSVMAYKFPNERYTSNTVMTRKIPEVVILRAGTIRVSYQVKSDGGGYHQVAKNGTLIDTEEWINNASYQQITKDVSVNIGDVITVHQKKNIANTFTRNFVISVYNSAQASGLVQLVHPAELSS